VPCYPDPQLTVAEWKCRSAHLDLTLSADACLIEHLCQAGNQDSNLPGYASGSV